MLLNLLLRIARVCNYSTIILRSGAAFKIGNLDVSERQLLLELRRIICGVLFGER